MSSLIQPYSNHIGATEALVLQDNDDSDVITSYQPLGKDFWDDLEDAKEQFHFRLNGLTHVASIPEAVVNKWLREGFDFWNAPAKEIILKLKIDQYSTFIVSGDKRF